MRPIYAVRPTAAGDISLPKDKTSSDAVAWSNTSGTYIPTPIYYDGVLYTCGNDGVLSGYLALVLRLDRLVPGMVDAGVIDRALRREVAREPVPVPADLVRQAGRLAAQLRLWTVVGGIHRSASDTRPSNCLFVISSRGE